MRVHLPKAVSFDLGGTLLYPDPPVGNAYATLLGEFGFHADGSKLNHRFKEAFHRHSRTPRSPSQIRDSESLWRSIVQDTLAGVIDLDENAFEDVFQHLYQAYTTARFWKLYDGIDFMLNTLCLKIPCLAISNGDSRFDRVLQELGIRSRFHQVLYSAEYGMEKPDSGLFHEACRQLNIQPLDLLHVGDSLYHDQKGARSADCQFFWLDHQHNSIHDFSRFIRHAL